MTVDSTEQLDEFARRADHHSYEPSGSTADVDAMGVGVSRA
jgi:hypothetical protein